MAVICSRFLSDVQLLGQCRLDVYRGSGPGGQKRNKTSNAVRLTHEPSGLSVTATESRSLAENRLQAIRRLRLKLAVELREPVDRSLFEPPDWLLSVRRDDRLMINHRHGFYPATVGLVLDLMAVVNGNPAVVAVNLGVSTTAVVKILESDHQIWSAANAIRKSSGLDPLRPRR